LFSKFVDFVSFIDTLIDSLLLSSLNSDNAPKEQYRIIYRTVERFDQNVIVDRIERILLPDQPDKSSKSLALFQLNTTIPLGYLQAQAINLNRQFDINTGDKLTMYGYSHLAEKLIMKDNVTAISSEDCRMIRNSNGKLYPSKYYHFCSNSDMSNFRYDDSGTLIIVNKEGKFYLAGIADGGYDETPDGVPLPSYHTDVRGWIEWIEKTVKDYTINWQDDYLASRIHQMEKAEDEENKFKNNKKLETGSESFDDPNDKRLYQKEIEVEPVDVFREKNALHFVVFLLLNILLIIIAVMFVYSIVLRYL